MRYFQLIPLILIIFSTGCSSTSNQKTNDSKTEISNQANNQFEDCLENSIVFDEDDKAPESILFIMNIIRNEYNSFSRFVNYPQYMEKTPVEGRFEVKGKFLSKESGQEYEKYYSTFIQKFEGKWEYGTLLIGSSQYPTLSNSSKILNGNLKEKEQESINKKETRSVEDINYTIIKRSAPNYIIIYTPNRLSRIDILKLYSEFKDQYESVRFTKNNDPDKDDYLCIQYDYVFDYEADNIIKLSEY